MDELMTLKKEKDRLEREMNSKEEHLLEAKTEVDKGALALKNADMKISTLKAQVWFNTVCWIVNTTHVANIACSI